MAFRYQERLHLTYEQLLAEPWERIELAHYIWSLDAEADKVRAERQSHK